MPPAIYLTHLKTSVRLSRWYDLIYTREVNTMKIFMLFLALMWLILALANLITGKDFSNTEIFLAITTMILATNTKKFLG